MFTLFVLAYILCYCRVPLVFSSQVISGYQEHVSELVSRSQRPAISNIYSLLGKDTCFALPGNQKPERRRRKSRASMSRRKLSPKLSSRKETTV